VRPRVSFILPERALPTETKVESGTPQSKSGTSVNLSNSGLRRAWKEAEEACDPGCLAWLDALLPRNRILIHKVYEP